LKLLPAVLLASLAAFPALARQDPTPKPSGIVIHLFGPGSITSSGTPSAPAQQAGQGAAPDGGNSQSVQGASNTQGGSTAAAQAAPSPTMGQVLHQMFVTGDPAQEAQPRFAPGRSGEP
jgi:hypothetical protein